MSIMAMVPMMAVVSVMAMVTVMMAVVVTVVAMLTVVMIASFRLALRLHRRSICRGRIVYYGVVTAFGIFVLDHIIPSF